jgi:hypothetical protein
MEFMFNRRQDCRVLTTVDATNEATEIMISLVSLSYAFPDNPGFGEDNEYRIEEPS